MELASAKHETQVTEWSAAVSRDGVVQSLVIAVLDEVVEHL